MAFLRHIWPRQLVARTARTAAALADLALSAGDNMPAVVDASLPLLTRVGPRWYGPLHLGGGMPVGSHPEAQLALLHAILPEDPTDWAHGTGDLIDRLAACGSLQADPRLVELRRRAMAR